MDDGGNVERMSKEKRSSSVGREDKRMAEGSDGRRKRGKGVSCQSVLWEGETRDWEKKNSHFKDC